MTCREGWIGEVKAMATRTSSTYLKKYLMRSLWRWIGGQFKLTTRRRWVYPQQFSHRCIQLGVRFFNKTLSMTNYLSIGVDACVTLGMQTTRSSIPRALSSRYPFPYTDAISFLEYWTSSSSLPTEQRMFSKEPARDWTRRLNYILMTNPSQNHCLI